jgi:hypothetical protein
MTPTFIPGLELSRLFFQQIIRPILAESVPALPHSAALIGDGSEVLGFDTEMSTDHDWGPRIMLFLTEADYTLYKSHLEELLRQKLPATFHGYHTYFASPEQPAPNAQKMEETGDDILHHRVQILTTHRFFWDYLRYDIDQPLAPADWLTFPEQKLRAITAGALFHDNLALQALRDRFAYYPHDVWLYLLASAWNRIGQEEHLMGRAGFAGDELGSAVIAARLVRDLMRLCFLMEREYAPYPKWFGTAFARLKSGPPLLPTLQLVLHAATWQEREEHLVQAYEDVANLHNNLGITAPLSAQANFFFDRPFRVIHLGGDFAGAIRAQITDPVVQRIAALPLIGSVDQFSDNTDLLSDPIWRERLKTLYESITTAETPA